VAERVIAGRYHVDDALPDDVPGAATYAATDTILGRPVRVRMLPSNQAGLLDAARRAALVTDPRLERVLDVGTLPDGRGYVINEAISGPSLLDLLRHNRLSGDQARSIVGEAATALEMARRRGVHHLALRPSAIHLAKDGRVVVTGLALDANLLGLQLADSVAATVDATDLVRLLYASMTGHWPLRPDDAVASSLPPADDREGRGWAAPAEIVPGVPTDLDRICRGLSVGQVPTTPGDLVRSLEPWGEIRVAAAGATPPSNPPARPDRSVPLPPPAQPTTAPPPQQQLGRMPDAPTQLTPALTPEQMIFGPDRSGAPRPAPAQDAPGPAPAARSGLTGLIPTAKKTYAEPSGRSTRVVLVSVAVVLLVAVVLGVTALLSRGGPAEADSPATTPTAAASATAVAPPPPAVPSPSVTSTTPTPTSTGAAVIESVTTYDPKDTDGEHQELVANLIDDDPSTGWYTRTYKTEDFGGLKPGVALVVTLDEKTLVSSVTINTTSSGGQVQILALDAKDPAEGDVLASGSLTSAQQTFTFKDPQEMSGLVVWISTLPTASDGSYRLDASSLSVN
jgi:eukaryotic-like serine/threonine-protein kinase